MKGLGVVALLILCSSHQGTAMAVKEEEKTTPEAQNVGGLLFDVDEGVKVEQGPGGSVYVKSNREYMQAKFEGIESRLAAIETRLAALESDPGEKSAPAPKLEEEPKVLVAT